MAYVILQLALTVDGYIARTDGRVDFLDDTMSEFEPEFQTFVSSIDSIVMGRNTYNQMLTFGEMPFTDKTIYVLTHQTDTPSEPHVQFTDKDLQSLMNELEGTVWLFGGAHVIAQSLDLQLIDEYQLFVVPHLIGDGIRLFPPNESQSRLLLLENKQYGSNIYLRYKTSK